MLTPDAVPSAHRLTPLDDDRWPPEIADLRTGFAGGLNVYRVMAHNAPLLRAWHDLREHLVRGGDLQEPHREIVILRVAFRWDSDYEWAHHVVRGRKAGLDEQRIQRARAPGHTLVLSNDGDALIAAVDALLDDGRLDDRRLDALARFLSPATILDIMALVGMYTTLAFILKTHQPPLGLTSAT